MTERRIINNRKWTPRLVSATLAVQIVIATLIGLIAYFGNQYLVDTKSSLDELKSMAHAQEVTTLGIAFKVGDHEARIAKIEHKLDI